MGAEPPPRIAERVVRLQLPTGATACGTFLTEAWLLTCHHTVPNRLVARATAAITHRDDIFRLEAETLRTCAALDYAAATVRGAALPQADLLEVVEWAIPVPGEELVLVRPGTRRQGTRSMLTGATSLVGPFVQYPAPTAYGWSGAPVFNRSWQLVAIHHKRGLLPGPNGEIELTSQAVGISEIVADLVA